MKPFKQLEKAVRGWIPQESPSIVQPHKSKLTKMLTPVNYSTNNLIVIMGLGCIFLSIPTFYLVNTYRLTYSIHPSDALTSFIKMLPFLFLSIVLLSGIFRVSVLTNNNKMKDAAKLASTMIVFLVIAIIVASLTFNIGITYIS